MTLAEVHVTGAIGDAIDEILRDGADEAGEYLKERFLSAAVLGLFEQRRAAGLTKAEVAERLGTLPPIRLKWMGARHADYRLPGIQRVHPKAETGKRTDAADMSEEPLCLLYRCG